MPTHIELGDGWSGDVQGVVSNTTKTNDCFFSIELGDWWPGDVQGVVSNTTKTNDGFF